MSATTLTAAPSRASRIDHLDQLEHRSVHLLREAYASFPQLAMLWSIGWCSSSGISVQRPLLGMLNDSAAIATSTFPVCAY